MGGEGVGGRFENGSGVCKKLMTREGWGWGGVGEVGLTMGVGGGGD